MSHTPTPWRVEKYVGGVYSVVSSNGVVVTTFSGSGRARANAEHIVRCVNSHDALTKALPRAIEMLDIAARYIREFCDDELIDYDGTTCDGACVAEDCAHAIEALQFALAEGEKP